MKPLFAKPHLFISYSRKDAALSEFLYRSLRAEGFSVYYDKEKTLIGENFVAEIVKELRRSDGVVALISKHSAESPWCQAELYHAHALGIMIAPIRLGIEPFAQAAPLDLLMKDINYIVVADESAYPQATRQIKQRLHAIRRMRHLRSLRNALVLLFLASALVFIWRFGIQSLNTIAKTKQRQALIERLKGSTATLTGDVINTYVQQFTEDDQLIAELLLMQNNPELSDNGRLNAHLMATALLSPRKQQTRWYIKEINWQNSTYEMGQLQDTTFMQGTIKDIQFNRVSFSGVVWSHAPSQTAAGLRLSNLKFTMCQFNAGQFFGTSGISLDFINCSFRGTTLDVTGFGSVHFFSQVSDPNSSVITNEVSVFENCAIENCVTPAAPGVIEIVPPDSEVRFTHIVFNGCHFRGLIRPTWFKDCHFTNCVLPKSVSQSSLEQRGNIVQDCSTAQEECY